MLDAAVAEDVAAGLLPIFLTGTIGTTSSCAVDPIEALAPICAAHDMWCANMLPRSLG